MKIAIHIFLTHALSLPLLLLPFVANAEDVKPATNWSQIQSALVPDKKTPPNISDSTEKEKTCLKELQELAVRAYVCETKKEGPPKKAKPIKAKKPTIDQLLAKKGVKKGNPVFIRIFKRESQLELWMKRGPRFTIVKTFKICSWSGKLGPKLKEGDYQSPEGFYYITKGSLNPNSNYHLSFNLGYPNAYDRAHKRTGSYLMVHGSCASIGCYAMTNEGIDEIYGLVKAALNKRHRFVSVHIFPFRMTAANIDDVLDNDWIDFWWNLKQGYDLFEARLLPPSARVCKRNYVFTPKPFSAGGITNWTRKCR